MGIVKIIKIKNVLINQIIYLKETNLIPLQYNFYKILIININFIFNLAFKLSPINKVNYKI